MKAALHLRGLVPPTPGAPFRAYTSAELERLAGLMAPFAADLAGRGRGP